jgi:hypothetical protein
VNSSPSTQTTTTTPTTPVSDVNAISCKNAAAGGTVNLSSMPSGVNVLPVTLNDNYANAPMASVKICETGSTVNCVIVDNLLVDTGSYGLRVFKSAMPSLNLTQINAPGGNPLAECALFGIGSTWGLIKSADITMGGESAVTIPIQVIDSTVAGRPSDCSDSDTDPSSAGYNGILGVGLFAEDCGTSCVAASPANDLYYSCNGATCTASNAPLAAQVVNPVARLSTDNNGVFLQLPSISTCGVETVNGALVLGIDTRTNNSSSAITSKFVANGYGEFSTTFNGQTYIHSFIDSGSNGWFFPRPTTLAKCSRPINGSDLSTFNCPYDPTIYTATQISGASSNVISFTVNNAYNLFLSPNYNFNDLSANWSTAFNWGLPFFYGRKIFVGVQGKSSNLGVGPYWAY